MENGQYWLRSNEYMEIGCEESFEYDLKLSVTFVEWNAFFSYSSDS